LSPAASILLSCHGGVGRLAVGGRGTLREGAPKVASGSRKFESERVDLRGDASGVGVRIAIN
jgi:hypothetical protein